MSGRLRVVLADDHAVVRTGYRRLLELEDDMEVVADFADSDAACAWFASHDADVLVLDLSMPGRGGLETLARVKARRPGLRVLVFSMHDSPAMVDQALRAGADGYLTKSSEPDALIDAVRRAARGEQPLSPDVASARAAGAQEAAHLSLTPREFAIFRLLAAGRTVEEIAARLFLSTKTVANYQTTIRQKTGLASVLDMYRHADAHRLLDGTE
ncbi:MAG TPA: response regulator transcription factor [Zoogloea sp.]|uniref:response regulator transcription factor n=1 Tax=Zoogloea sp. TaxID=49181 RepID=UPI002B721014|nr:response regulator transcription factor [Zoogloea sp.]HOB45347.1 response regulator transcription factor [Zoogloea sp.]HQA09580.1 response regulator transcription factor [Zoogloea sp.]HQE38426.1 response regulator transcription factor [Zoogloea sp.]